MAFRARVVEATPQRVLVEVPAGLFGFYGSPPVAVTEWVIQLDPFPDLAEPPLSWATFRPGGFGSWKVSLRWSRGGVSGIWPDQRYELLPDHVSGNWSYPCSGGSDCRGLPDGTWEQLSGGGTAGTLRLRHAGMRLHAGDGYLVQELSVDLIAGTFSGTGYWEDSINYSDLTITTTGVLLYRY